MKALHIAHQFDAAMHSWLQQRLPADARLDRLPPDDPWRVPDGTNVLLVTNGKLRSLTRDRPGWADRLEWMHMWPTGLDEAPGWVFDLTHVTVSRGAAAVAISEYVLAAMLDFEKRLPELRVTSPASWVPAKPGSLAGRSLGLFGFGEIGQAIAERALAFRVTVRAMRRRSDAPSPPGVEFVSLDELCASSDHLVLCAPLTAETAGTFDDARFALCRPGQHLVNVARGALIRPDALRRALGGTIARASLDVWNEEPPPPGHWVFDHPRLHLTPHTSSRGSSTDARLLEILEGNLTAWLAARPQDLFGQVSPSLRY
jgi:phosphoglycerate dehydrogenase-like enzyme